MTDTHAVPVDRALRHTELATLPVDRALRRTELINAIGVAIGSLEFLARPKQLAETGLLSWPVGRTRFRWSTKNHVDVLNRLFNPPGVYGLIALRLLASAALLNPRASRATRTSAVTFLAGTNWALHVRNGFGTDGTDHMNMLTHAALAASKLFPHDKLAREACAWFIAGQSVLSYASAGAAKLLSPFWRDGSAMAGIFRTHTYGTKWVGELMKKYPVLATAGGWGVILGELAFPLVLVAPKPVARALLGLGTSFHVGNAAFMGLNRFVWAFSATYPSVIHVSKHLNEGDFVAM